MSGRRQQKKRSGGGSFIFGSLSAILICGVLFLGVSVFFKVSKFEVSGSASYTEEQIIEASGIRQGSNLVFLDREKAQEHITDKLVYIWKATVKRKLPNTVTIQVWESGTFACVRSEEGYWTIDNHGRLLEPCSAREVGEFLRVEGFTAIDPAAGKKIEVAEGDSAKVAYLEKLLTALYEADMLSDVRDIDMSTSSNPQFIYLERFRVKLGREENTEAKLGILKSAVEKLEPEETGTFDLSRSGTANFSPGELTA